MTIAQRIGALEASSHAHKFIALAKIFCAARCRAADAAAIAREMGQPGLADIFERSIAPGTTTTWSALADYNALATAFAASLRSVSVFDTALPLSLQVPILSAVGAITVGAVGYSTPEASMKPVSAMTLTSEQLPPRKGIAAIVVSVEVAKLATPEATALFAAALRTAATQAVDGAFLSIALDGVVPAPASGSTADALRIDFAAALQSMTLSADSKLLAVLPADLAKNLPFLGGSDALFDGLTVNGGVLAGIVVLPSDAAPAATVSILDVSQFAMSAGPIELNAYKNSTIQMTDALADSPPAATTVLVDTWSANLVTLVAERFFSAKRLRPGAASQISNANYAPSGNSPP